MNNSTIVNIEKNYRKFSSKLLEFKLLFNQITIEVSKFQTISFNDKLLISSKMRYSNNDYVALDLLIEDMNIIIPIIYDIYLLFHKYGNEFGRLTHVYPLATANRIAEVKLVETIMLEHYERLCMALPVRIIKSKNPVKIVKSKKIKILI